jgi:hypothetical protein
VSGGYYNPGVVNTGNRGGTTTGVYYGPRQTGTVNTSPRGPVKTDLETKPRGSGVDSEKIPDTRGGNTIRTDTDKKVDATPRTDRPVDKIYVPSAGREPTAGNRPRDSRPTYTPDTDRNIRPSYQPRNDGPTRATVPDRTGQDRTYTPTRQEGTRSIDRGSQRGQYEHPSTPTRTYSPPARPSTPSRATERSSSPSRGSATPSRSSGSSSPRSSGGSSQSSSPRRGN